MIIRILSEGQYELKGPGLVELDEMDNQVLDAIEANDAGAFQAALGAVIRLVQEKGRKLDDATLVESDLILPAPDMTLEEAKALFAAYPRELQA